MRPHAVYQCFKECCAEGRGPLYGSPTTYPGAAAHGGSQPHQQPRGDALLVSAVGQSARDKYDPFPSLLLPHPQPLKEHPGTAVSIGFKEKLRRDVVSKWAH